jgi:LytS/YehU family sensor histidine kinase
LGGIVAFSAVFRGLGMNFAFLVFPAVIFAAVRFGTQELAASLFFVIGSIYVALALQASHVPSEEMPTIIWFTQAFCWVLASTGLVIAALVSERLQAEALASTETRRALEASLREERARLDALRYQINPHFLFNSLNAIRASIPESSTQSDSMIADLAGYLRTTLDQSDADTTTLRDEIRSAHQYLALEHRRFGDDLAVSFVIDPATEEAIVPVFLLQPLIENAIRHGFESSKGAFSLVIRSSQDDSKLIIEVINTGTWHEPVDDGRKHLGLQNIRRRLTLLHGDCARLDIKSEDNFVSVYIEILKGKSCAA